MALTIPRFIDDAGVQTVSAAAFPWDQTVYESIEDYRSKNLRAALLRSSPHANLAFGLAVAEWICWRLRLAVRCEPTLDYIEGIWAAIVDRRYLAKKEMEFEPLAWTDGPADAIRVVNSQLYHVYSKSKKNDPERTAEIAQLVALARHVLPDHRAFDQWAAESLKRLASWFPSTKDLGAAVPRVALDPTFPYDPGRRSAYVDDFLLNLSPAENPFLAKPEALAADGFAGTPYRFTE